MKLGKMIIGVCFYLDILFVFPAPLHAARRKSASEITVQNWMNVYTQTLMLLHNQVSKVFYNVIFKNKCRRYFTRTITARTNFTRVDVHLRLHTLPCDLHQSKF